MSRSEDVAGVVLLHGMARRASSMTRMRRALERAGFATLNLDYDSRRKSLDRLAEDIHPAISAFAADIGGSLHMVTHSMGGLLARVYRARHRPMRLGRVVMLGPPNQGSEIADRLQHWRLFRLYFGPAGQQLTTSAASREPLDSAIDYDLGVIAGSRSIDPVSSLFMLPGANDGRVTVERTKVSRMTDHVTVKTPHVWLVNSPAVIAQTIVFLREARFDHVGLSGAPRDSLPQPPR